MEVTWKHGSGSGSGLEIFLEAEAEAKAKVDCFHITDYFLFHQRSDFNQIFKWSQNQSFIRMCAEFFSSITLPPPTPPYSLSPPIFIPLKP